MASGMLDRKTRPPCFSVIAVDGTGIKVTNRGEWVRRKRKGYIKIHVGVDTKTKQVVSLEVTDEGKKLKPLVRKARRKARVKKVLGDSGYDSHENFEFLAASGIEAALKVREDSNPNCGRKREEVVRAYLRDPPGWKERVGYGQRWMGEKTFFSGFKRLFGEVVKAVRFERDGEGDRAEGLGLQPHARLNCGPSSLCRGGVRGGVVGVYNEPTDGAGKLLNKAIQKGTVCLYSFRQTV